MSVGALNNGFDTERSDDIARRPPTRPPPAGYFQTSSDQHLGHDNHKVDALGAEIYCQRFSNTATLPAHVSEA